MYALVGLSSAKNPKEDGDKNKKNQSCEKRVSSSTSFHFLKSVVQKLQVHDF